MENITAFALSILYALTVVGLALAMFVGLFYITHLCMQLERRWGPPLNRWIDGLPAEKVTGLAATPPHSQASKIRLLQSQELEMSFSCDCCKKVFPNDELSTKFQELSLCQKCSEVHDYCHGGCGKLCGELEAGLTCNCGYFLCEECSEGLPEDWVCPDPNCEHHGQ